MSLPRFPWTGRRGRSRGNDTRPAPAPTVATEASEGIAVGLACRELHHEDRLLVDRQRGLFGVFDGVGGQGKGDEAATLAADIVGRVVSERVSAVISPDEAQRLLVRALEQADSAIAEHNRPHDEAGALTSATTAAVALLRRVRHGHESRFELTVVAVGDSRVQLLRADRLSTITLDDSALAGADPRAARSRQDRLDQVTSPLELSDPMDRAAFVHRNLLSQALDGRGLWQPHSYAMLLAPDDRLVLDSDGVHDNLTSSETATILQSARDPQAAAAALTDAAWGRSRESAQESERAKPDDISAIVVDVLG